MMIELARRAVTDLPLDSQRGTRSVRPTLNAALSAPCHEASWPPRDRSTDTPEPPSGELTIEQVWGQFHIHVRVLDIPARPDVGRRLGSHEADPCVQC